MSSGLPFWLLALYAANPAKLGDFGFEVIEATAPVAAKKPARA